MNTTQQRDVRRKWRSAAALRAAQARANVARAARNGVGEDAARREYAEARVSEVLFDALAASTPALDRPALTRIADALDDYADEILASEP